MGTISYDHSVKNFIPELSATGHVTHQSFTKTSVTLHHNAGRLTHEGILAVWRTRAASAHFDVDSTGSVAQYVDVHEYAWAVGDKGGNQSSISIEMCNETLAPAWTVSNTTWESAARLAGWLFAHVVKHRPTEDNFFVHHHWSSTACAGPYIDKIFKTEIIPAAQKAYDNFVGPDSKPKSTGASSLTALAEEVIAGKWGNGEERVKRLEASGYNPSMVQQVVNKILEAKPKNPPKESVTKLAAEVIAGKWGNGAERVERLEKAGYNAKAVQEEVNRQLR